MRTTISRYISAATSLLLFVLPAVSQTNDMPQHIRETVEAHSLQHHDTLFRGVAVSGDLVGLAQKPFGSKFGYFEGAARINLCNRYFPIFEMGYAFCDNTGDETSIRFKTNAPYFRIGADYNFLKNKNSGNRVFGGVRYGFSSFKYDVSDPSFSDPVWNVKQPYDFKGIQGTAHWAELVFGIEAKIWSIVHLGWSARYKVRLQQKESIHGTPWYIPGFGKNTGTTCWGGTFSVIFDV
jgi:hypothetical protein